MSSLTNIRDTREILCGATVVSRKAVPAEGAVIYTGAMVALNADGKAVPASDSASLTVAGICQGHGDDGSVMIRSGVFQLENGTGSDALSASDIGKIVYVLDDQTVGKTGGTHKIAAGILRAVEASGVQVEVGNGPVTGYIPVPNVISADPDSAASGNRGSVVIVGGSGWTSGTSIPTGSAGEIYMSNGSAWVKLG